MYCSDCFGKKGGRDGGERSDRGGRDFAPRTFQKPAFEQPRTDGDTKRRLESIEYKLDKVIHAVDMLLGAKLPAVTKAVEVKAKDAAKIKEELTAVVKKVSKEAVKETKTAKPAAKKAKAKK